MATENPMRVVDSGGAGNWAPPRGSPAFSRPAGARVVAGELGFLLGGRNVIDVDRSNVSPNSAPPSVEGSFAAFGNNWGSPLIHGHGTEASVFVPGGYLSTHEEESGDDRSPQQHMLSFDGRHKSLVDLIQEDFPRTPSPVFSHNRSSTHAEEPLHREMESLSLESQSSKQPESTDTKDPSLSPQEQILTSDAAYFASDFVSGGPISSAADDQENQNLGFDEQQHTYSQHYHVPISHAPANNSPMVSHAPLYGPNTAYMGTGNSIYPNFNSSGLYPQYGGGYAMPPTYLPPYLAQYPSQTSGYPLHFNPISNQSVAENLSRFYGQQHGLSVLPSTFPDPSLPYFHHTLQNPYNVPLQYCNLPSPGMISYPTSGSNSYISSPTCSGFAPQFPLSPFGSPVLPQSPVGGGGLGREYDFGFSQSSPRNAGYGRWKGKTADNGSNEHRKTSFLEEVKASSAGRIDISEIVGHIAEFSIDQHGSRFIQSTLENCSVEEKELVFKEILPHCSKLITDVFGNYVIQKFFERGTYEQRRDLASQLSGQILQLSLQMYGCRVIQKALEFVEVEKMTELALELDGHVMKCVRDQNANHVLQKCIEYMPTEKNYFIFSAFEGQVATLSTHPYGCRVIQRILEHCSNDLCCQSVVDEILEFAYDLAHDQFGNYVIQHILERGKPLERSQIINKVYGSIVRMSHHKYASNVVEKCLGFGDANEQQLLIEEILLQSEDNNDNLLAMMKDQFANYVVQKVLEISEDEQRERLLDRIQPHLVALRKYTYGKHIVARFEQLRGEGADLDGC